MANQILLNQVAVDTESDAYESQGGPAIITIRGDNYGGGSVTIQFASSNDNSPRYLVEETYTADATKFIQSLPSKVLVKAELTGSTGASNVFVDIVQ